VRLVGIDADDGACTRGSIPALIAFVVASGVDLEVWAVPKRGLRADVLAALYRRIDAAQQLALSPAQPAFRGRDEDQQAAYSMWLWERVQGMTLAAAVCAGRQTLTEHSSLFRYWLQLLAGAVQVRCALSGCDCGVER
jgi:hypothetical protein